MAPLEILIVGCGIAGSTLASFLLLSDDIPASEKPHITILERSPAQRSQGQNIDIRGAGISIIRKLGLEKVIRASTTGEVGVQWVDEQNKVWAAIGADRSGELSTPTADIEILRGKLAELCWLRSESISEQVKSEGGAGIEFVWGDYLSKIDQDGSKVNVTFAKSGQQRSYNLLVGADGLQSGVRKLVWGNEGEAERLKPLDAYAWFFSIPKGPTDTDWRRWFHASGRRNIMLRPSQPGEDKTTVFAFVVTDQDKRLVDVAAKGRDALETQKSLFEEYFRGVGWESQRLMTEMRKTPDFYSDIIGQVKMDTWSKGRVVLLGDAGYVSSKPLGRLMANLLRYCASPFSGMGTTLALSGAYNLAGALLHHPTDHTAAFAQYREEMLPTVTRAQKLFPGMPWSLSPDTAWGVWAINMAVYLMTSSGLPKLIFKYLGPPANKVEVKEYGFRSLPEWAPEGDKQ
jgi:2-polyprenyl-6-methoxyphenol hydroxylase-like FAD-dependent oxidoreductase